MGHALKPDAAPNIRQGAMVRSWIQRARGAARRESSRGLAWAQVQDPDEVNMLLGSALGTWPSRASV